MQNDTQMLGNSGIDSINLRNNDVERQKNDSEPSAEQASIDSGTLA